MSIRRNSVPLFPLTHTETCLYLHITGKPVFHWSIFKTLFVGLKRTIFQRFLSCTRTVDHLEQMRLFHELLVPKM